MTLDVWLQPVAGEDPCGDNLEYDAEFQQLEEAATEKRGEEFGRDGGDVMRIEGKAANWNEVRTLAEGLLARSKDLRVAVYLTRALLHTQGFSGIADGLALINGLFEKFWEGVHPRLEEEDQDATIRVNALVPLGSLDAVVADVRGSMVLKSRRYGQLAVREIEIAQGRLKPPADARVHSESELGVLLAAAVEEDPGIRRVAGQALASLKAVTAIISERAGESVGVDFKALQTVLFNVDQAFASAVPEDLAADAATDVASEAPGSPDLPTGRARAAAAAGEISSREDVVRILGRLCDYLVRHEPTNPVQILLRRAQRMMNMSFLELMHDLAPDGLEQAETVVGEKLNKEEE
ncbi:type VI secretion system protein TssA [Accumulibacter sp.]|uniref:type VI secretion system protein TssA n=1 Tax=Accumulibacter sp. TaxID=2053492 RepID=UPI0025FE5F5F|nr:type VI secretion system protein TssA [Accumulibacter sp.]MCM8612049.1 type VI secretion system protein TssA [Accumulibacter sp.]MCM8636031.1 type VI secretion system protein TssA [Accumulibacter sp.]MCM8639872.1 type VI secretion system protein TssA [Accumulibacter sp.]